VSLPFMPLCNRKGTAFLENVSEMGMVFTFAPGMDLPAHHKCRAQPDLPIPEPPLFGVGRALPADSSERLTKAHWKYLRDLADSNWGSSGPHRG
jgi:hypothetical protein